MANNPVGDVSASENQNVPLSHACFITADRSVVFLGITGYLIHGLNGSGARPFQIDDSGDMPIVVDEDITLMQICKRKHERSAGNSRRKNVGKVARTAARAEI